MKIYFFRMDSCHHRCYMHGHFVQVTFQCFIQKFPCAWRRLASYVFVLMALCGQDGLAKAIYGFFIFADAAIVDYWCSGHICAILWRFGHDIANCNNHVNDIFVAIYNLFLCVVFHLVVSWQTGLPSWYMVYSVLLLQQSYNILVAFHDVLRRASSTWT